MLLLIAFSSFCTAALGLMALLRREPTSIDLRVEALRSETGSMAVPGLPLYSERRISPLARRGIEVTRSLLPRYWYQKLEKALIAAGDPVDPGLFLMFWIVVGLGLPLLGFLYSGRLGLYLGVLIGVVGPFMWLRREVRRRRQRISAALPDALDLLVACVEAGLGLEAALIRVSEATEGPLGLELRRTLGEVSVGRPRQEALLELGDRTGVPDLDGFLRPIVQAERLGVSIGNSLRIQSDALRERRRQRAQEHAQKLPAKMVMPMVGFFIPAIMVIGFAIAVFSLIDTFSRLGISP